MILVIVSVQHTGTRFIREHLLRKFIRHDVVFPNEEPNLAYDVLLSKHILQDDAKLIRHIDGRNLIIPLRRIDRVICSWESRGMEIAHLRQAFQILQERYNHFDPWYIPIDHPDRDQYLIEMSKGLGIELQTDWPVIHSEKGNANSSWENIQDKQKARNLIRDLAPFFGRFYEEYQ